LRAVERELLERAAAGDVVDLSDRPRAESTVAAAVVADLCGGRRWPVHAKGVQLVGATIDGPLDLQYATLAVPLRLLRCELADGVDLGEAEAPLVDLAGCSIGRGVRADGLRARRLSLFEAQVDGAVELRGAVIADALIASELVADHLDLRAAHVTGSVLFLDATVGRFRALAATIGGGLELDGAQLTEVDADGYSLDVRNMQVGANATFRDGFTSAGAVRADSASIAGSLVFGDARLGGADAGGFALRADRLRVGGALTSGPGFEAAGAVWLNRAGLGSDLWLIAARIGGTDAGGTALHGTSLRVGGAVRLVDLEAAGAVRLSDAVIEGSLTLRGAQLTGAVDGFGNSLAADGIRVGRSMHLSGGFQATGEVRLVGATIDGQLSLEGAEPFPFLALRGARCAELADTSDSWPAPGRLQLRGFRFDVLKMEPGWSARLDWVRRQGFVHWSPEPYEQLAAYYSSTGDEDAARRIRVAKHDDELTHLRTTKGRRSLGYRMWRRPLGWLVGYGYRRHRTAWLLAATLLLSGALFQRAEDEGAMVADQPATPAGTASTRDETCGEAHPCFNAWVYGADVVLPIIDFGQDTTWRPIETPAAGSLWVWARWVFIAVGWLLASVFVAAFSGLVQRG
jgi:hypothetical protein